MDALQTVLPAERRKKAKEVIHREALVTRGKRKVTNHQQSSRLGNERFLTYFRYDIPVIPKGVTSFARELVTQRVVSQK